MKLRVVPCSIDRAREYVATLHRHHSPSTSRTLWAVAVADDAGAVRGVAMVGLPVARYQDDGWTLEVHRVATDGCDNACSALYGAAARQAKALGYHRIITYIREDEDGVTLRAAGWVNEETPTGGLGWSRPHLGRARVETTELMRRRRWATTFAAHEPIELDWPHLEIPDQLIITQEAFGVEADPYGRSA